MVTLCAILANELVCMMHQPILLDASRFLDKNLGRDARVRYIAVGKAE